jgi:hypothetical protein
MTVTRFHGYPEYPHGLLHTPVIPLLTDSVYNSVLDSYRDQLPVIDSSSDSSLDIQLVNQLMINQLIINPDGVR